MVLQVLLPLLSAQPQTTPNSESGRISPSQRPFFPPQNSGETREIASGKQHRLTRFSRLFAHLSKAHEAERSTKEEAKPS